MFPFSVVDVAVEEVRYDSSYRYDNSLRGDPDRLVLQRTIEGEGWFEDAAGHRRVPVGYAMLFTHREHSCYGYPPEATTPYRLRFFCLTRVSIQPLFDRLRLDFGAVVRLNAGGEAARLFDQIFVGVQHQSLRDRFEEAELVGRLFIALYREQALDLRQSDPIAFGHDYLLNHFRRPLSIKEVAGQVGISREHFSRKFQARYGVSPGRFLTGLRLARARAMLAAGDLSITDIAAACGYASRASFVRAHLRKEGQVRLK